MVTTTRTRPATETGDRSPERRREGRESLPARSESSPSRCIEPIGRRTQPAIDDPAPGRITTSIAANERIRS